MIRKSHKKQRNPVKATLRVMQTRPEIRVHYTDLEEFVNKVLNTEFKFLKSAGMTHGMIPEYRVDGQILANDRRVSQIRNGRIGQSVGLMLNVLAHDGKISKGDYVIDTYKKPHPMDVYRQLLEDHRDPNHPECRRLRRQHQRDKVFTRNAALLDEACREIYPPSSSQ